MFYFYVGKHLNNFYCTLSYTIQSAPMSGYGKAWIWESEKFDPESNI